MKKLIKTLTLVTTGLVVGVVVGRASKSKDKYVNSQHLKLDHRSISRNLHRLSDQKRENKPANR